MNLLPSISRLCTGVLITGALAFAQAPKPAATSATPAKTYPPELVTAGETTFVQHCAFCHGRDTAGGEAGPDLTRSKLVADDIDGNQLGPIVRNGKDAMPKFTVSDQELMGLTAFIHTRKAIAESQKGGRRGVDVADLQTGDLEKGKTYFNGAGKCASCHSPTGDLAGVANRNQGLRLFQRLMNPRSTKVKMTVTAGNQTLTGIKAYQDEFTVALRDSEGRYHSWPTSKVKFTVEDPAQAHVDLLSKYTDDDIHNVIKYLMSLK
ncbi:MAG: cytochrome c [Candidatus Solibacter sp.]